MSLFASAVAAVEPIGVIVDQAAVVKIPPTGISLEDHALTVLTDEDESVEYGFDELDELAHAYAVTIHRSQGSEYPAVVIPLTMGSWMMLQRNLLYTGVTRAKKLVVLAGSRRALAVAVRSKGSGRRHTALAHRLRA